MTLTIPEIILAVIISAAAIGLIEFCSWTFSIILGLYLTKEDTNEKKEN
jgi:hypothetical protein